jgi:hypothetical protein
MLGLIGRDGGYFAPWKAPSKVMMR